MSSSAGTEAAAGSEDGYRCTAALQILASGRLHDFRGLPTGCRREHAETALGPTPSGPDGVAQLGDLMLGFRDYRTARKGAPYGVTVWFVENEIAVVQINSPLLSDSLERALGAPEAKTRSLLRAFYTQWVYASRGLTAHVSNRDPSGSPTAVLRLYAYPPTTVETFLSSPLSRVETRRIPLRR